MSREVNLPELIQLVWDKDLYNTRFTSTDENTVIEFFEEDDWDVYGEDCKKTTVFRLSDMVKI